MCGSKPREGDTTNVCAIFAEIFHSEGQSTYLHCNPQNQATSKHSCFCVFFYYSCSIVSWYQDSYCFPASFCSFKALEIWFDMLLLGKKKEKYSILLRFIQTQNYFQIWFDPAAAACMDFAFSFYSAPKEHLDLRIKNCRERTEVYDKTPVPLYPWRAFIYSTRKQRDLQSVSLDLISPPVGEERKIQFPESSYPHR